MTAWKNWGNSRRVLGHAEGGKYALQMGPQAEGRAQDVQALLIPGNSYRLLARAKLSDLREAAWIGVKLRDAAGTVLLEKSVQVKGTSYARHSLEFVAVPGAATAHVYVWKDEGVGHLCTQT